MLAGYFTIQMLKPTREDYANYPHIELNSPDPWSPRSYKNVTKEANLVASIHTLNEWARIDDQEVYEANNLDCHINLINSL